MTEREIFLAALDQHDSAARAAYLEHACAGDAGLRERVEALLRSHEAAGSFLERPAVATPPPVASREAETAAATPDTSETGTFAPVDPNAAGARAPVGPEPSAARAPGREEIGTVVARRYTLAEVLGEGGMGTVYRALQTEPVKRPVALKLIKAGMDSKVVLARFDAERQALALMDHPNIARIYDGGVTDRGQPFFVMELVQGVPLTEYCDQMRLSVNARLQLFVSVCQAVQHAHQKGIIHRDLKPGNVLVTEVDGWPTPKVIDFGVAKATEQKLTDMSFSDAGAIVGTPAYMSPEQADPSSTDIDTRTDVYALGIILYELLVGSPPLQESQVRRGAVLEMLRIVREVDPPRPSTRLSTAEALPSIAANRATEPAQLARWLRGELDWVVMKAIAKDRSRRYDTASGLSRDIQRYLADEVVEARPPGTGYRLRKFLHRHKGQVLAAGLVLAVLLAGVVGTTTGWIRAQQANADLATANTSLAAANTHLAAANVRVDQRYHLAADAVRTFHTGVSEDFLLRQPAFKDLRDRLLMSAAEFYGKLSALLGAETDPASRRALVRANFELAELTARVGRNEDALAMHRVVLAAREALATEPEADPELRIDVGRSLIAVATALEAAGKSDDALAEYRRAEVILAEAADPAARAALATCRLRMGWLLSRIGKTDDALAAYKLARADPRASAGPAAPADVRRDEADAIVRVGLLLQQTGKSADAEVEYRRAQSAYQQLVEEHPRAAGYRNSLGFTHNSLGYLLQQKGDAAGAEDEYRRALAVYQKLAAEQTGVTEFHGRVAQSHHNLGTLQSGAGKAEAAEAEFHRALAIRRKLVADHPGVADHQSDLAHTHNNFGNLLLQTGRVPEAEAEHRRALALRRKLTEAEPGNPGRLRSVGSSLTNLGAIDVRYGRLDAAAVRYGESVEIHDRLVRQYPAVAEYRSGLAFALTGLGRSRHRAGRSAEAVEPLRRAVALRSATTAMNLDARYDQVCGHALLAAATGDPAEADRAMASLGRAVAGGFRKLTALQTDPDLAPLRARADFKALLGAVERSAPKAPEVAPPPRSLK